MRQRTIKIPDELNERLEARMRELDRSANWIVARALERELSEAKDIRSPMQADPVSVPSSEGVRSAASSQASEPEMRGLAVMVESAESGGNAIHSLPEDKAKAVRQAELQGLKNLAESAWNAEADRHIAPEGASKEDGPLLPHIGPTPLEPLRPVPSKAKADRLQKARELLAERQAKLNAAKAKTK